MATTQDETERTNRVLKVYSNNTFMLESDPRRYVGTQLELVTHERQSSSPTDSLPDFRQVMPAVAYGVIFNDELCCHSCAVGEGER